MRGITIKSLKTNSKQNQITMIIRDWAPGIYIASLKINGLLMESIKFAVIK